MWVDEALLLLDMSVSGCKHCFGGGGEREGGGGGGMGVKGAKVFWVDAGGCELWAVNEECKRVRT